MNSNYRYTRRTVRRKGRLDGRGWRWKFPYIMKESFPVYPADDQQEPALFEVELFRAGEDHLADLVEDWSEKDKSLKSRYCDALAKLQLAIEDKKEELDDVEEARDMYDQALAECQGLQEPAFSKTFEWIIIVVLAISEFFFNYMIFNVLGAPKLDTMIIALTVSFALPLSAMGFGHLLRLDKRTLAQRIWLIVLGVLPFIVFLAIAVVRASLFELVWEEANEESPLSPFMATLAFIFINLLIWVVAAFVSYRASHRDPENYRKLKMRLKDAKKQFERDGRDYEQAVKAYEAARLAYEKARHLRKEEFDVMTAQAKDLIKTVKWYISVYRSSNQEVRRSGAKPPCFKTPIPELMMPGDFQENRLDWECDVDISSGFITTPSAN